MELSGDKSQLTFATEVNSIGPLNPKFGLNLNLSLDATGGSGPQSELDKQESGDDKAQKQQQQPRVVLATESGDVDARLLSWIDMMKAKTGLLR